MDFKKIIITIIVIVLIVVLLRYLFSNQVTTPIADAKIMQRIPASDLVDDSRQSNSNFTHSIWFNIDNWNYRYGSRKHILYRDSDEFENLGISCFLAKMTNDLTIKVNTYGDIAHECTVKNIPVQKWVHLLVSVYGKSMDIYIDGKLVRTCVLPGLAKVDKSKDVLITPENGFSGYTSKYQFKPEPTNPEQAFNIYKAGFSKGGALSALSKYKLKMSFYSGEEEKASLEI